MQHCVLFISWGWGKQNVIFISFQKPEYSHRCTSKIIFGCGSTLHCRMEEEEKEKQKSPVQSTHRLVWCGLAWRGVACRSKGGPAFRNVTCMFRARLQCKTIVALWIAVWLQQIINTEKVLRDCGTHAWLDCVRLPAQGRCESWRDGKCYRAGHVIKNGRGSRRIKNFFAALKLSCFGLSSLLRG